MRGAGCSTAATRKTPKSRRMKSINGDKDGDDDVFTDSHTGTQLYLSKMSWTSHRCMSPFSPLVGNGKRIRMKRKSLDHAAVKDIQQHIGRSITHRRTSLPELSPGSKGIMEERKDGHFGLSGKYSEVDWVSHGLGKLEKMREKMETFKKKARGEIPISEKIQMGIIPQNKSIRRRSSVDETTMRTTDGDGDDGDGVCGDETFDAFVKQKTNAATSPFPLHLPSHASHLASGSLSLPLPLQPRPRRRSFDDRVCCSLEHEDDLPRPKPRPRPRPSAPDSTPSTLLHTVQKKKIVIVIPSIPETSK
eukprot:TRINITY_DN305_c1_g1_i1.p1 TRINITY_DN305_c1_g1~~TRINITY_DN305_c1_g1_i1.p1  ORF type:complete len:305 (-),score=82.40 TRINITY_DN305_c1_g1_i1:132-1046(-)